MPRVPRAIHSPNPFVNAVTHSSFSSSHSPLLPPSSSCTSQQRLSRASRNKPLWYRVVAPLLGWIPPLSHCKTAHSRCAYRLHYHNIGSLRILKRPRIARLSATCHHVNSSLSRSPKSKVKDYLRCDHDCPTNYTTHVMNSYFRGLPLNHTSSDRIHEYIGASSSRRVDGVRNRQGQMRAR